MTLREMLDDIALATFKTHTSKRLAWTQREKYYSKVSGKQIIGYPTEHSSYVPVFLDRVVFDAIKVGDGEYEFYVSKDGDKTLAAYDDKNNYIGTFKFNKFKTDEAGILMEGIRKFINSKKIDSKSRKYMLFYYNKKRNHPYYEGYFPDIGKE